MRADQRRAAAWQDAARREAAIGWRRAYPLPARLAARRVYFIWGSA